MLSQVLPASYLLIQDRFSFHLQWSARHQILLCYNKPCLRRRLSILVNHHSFQLLFTKTKLFDGVVNDLDELEVNEFILGHFIHIQGASEKTKPNYN